MKDPSVTCAQLLAFCKQCTDTQMDRLNKWPLFLLLVTWFLLVMDVGRKCFLEGLVFWIDQECTCRANLPITLTCRSLVHITECSLDSFWMMPNWRVPSGVPLMCQMFGLCGLVADSQPNPFWNANSANAKQSSPPAVSLYPLGPAL